MGILRMPLHQSVSAIEPNPRLCLKPPQRMGFWGPSGCGKSSLMLALAGLREVPWCRAAVDGQAISKMNATMRARMRREVFGLVFQDLRLLDDLSAYANILLTPHKDTDNTSVLPESGHLSHIQLMADELGLNTEQMQRPVSTLSLGQRQRVALMQALLGEFSWLILDEPFAHLDAATADRASALIDAVCQRKGAGLLLLAHAPASPLKVDCWLPIESGLEQISFSFSTP